MMSREIKHTKRMLAIVITVCGLVAVVHGQSDDSSTRPQAGEPYPNMPSIAPIGVRIAKYLDVPPSSQGPAIDPAKGYRLQDLGSGLYICLLYTSDAADERSS